MTVLLWMLSGAIGFIFALIQGKIIINDFMFIFMMIFSFIGFFTIDKIKNLKKDRVKILEKFKKDKKC